MTYDAILALLIAEVLVVCDQQGITQDVTPDTPLLAEGAVIDSLDLVNVVVGVETALADKRIDIEIVDEQATTGLDSPFRTVASLARHIKAKVDAGPR